MPGTRKPSDLTSLKEPLIVAVTSAYMTKKMTEVGEWNWDHGLCEDGEIRYNDDRFGLDTKVYVSYPGGQWKEDFTWQGDPDRDVGYHAGEDLVLFDAAAEYAMVRQKVSEWIDPWISCPDPDDFTSGIQSLATAANKLYVEDAVRVGGNEVSGGGANNSTDVEGPIADVKSAIDDTKSDLSSLNGLAIDALEGAYVNDVALTISGQRALAIVAALAIAGEAEAWGRAYYDLYEFFKQATEDFKNYAKSRDASGQGVEQTLSIISGTTGAAAAGAFAFPPASAALGIVSGVAGVGALFYPTQDEVKATPIVLKGDNFDEYWESFKKSVRDANSELVDAEYNLAMGCRKVLTSLSSEPNSYSITRTAPGGTSQPGDNQQRFLDTNEDSAPIELYAGDVINVVHEKLKTVSGRIEHIGDHQRTVANGLGGATAAGTSTDGQGAWSSRGYLDGGIIGWGPTGHFSDYNAVVDGLIDLLLDESKNAHRVAEHCIDISTSFKQTDAENEAALDQIETSLYG